MVFIEAYIKPFKLDDVKEALEELGVGGVTACEVLQSSEARPRGRSFGQSSSGTVMVPKLKLEIAVSSELAERVIEAVCLHGSTGRTEDGRIVVERLDGTVRIRTGDTNDDALSF